MTAYQNARLGWLAAGQVATAPVGTTTYAIGALEQPGTCVAVVRLPRTYTRKGAVSDYYYVEYREPSGFDADRPPKPGVSGVTIRVAPDPPRMRCPSSSTPHH